MEDGRTGLVVPPRDPAALAEALVKLLRDDRARSGHVNSASGTNPLEAGAPELWRGLRVTFVELLIVDGQGGTHR